MSLPRFVHPFPEFWQHSWEYEEAHSKQSGLHVEMDMLLDDLQERPMWLLRKYPMFQNKLRAIISFIWGINCGFPLLDVIKFTIWEYRGCPPVGKQTKRM